MDRLKMHHFQHYKMKLAFPKCCCLRQRYFSVLQCKYVRSNH